MTAELEGPKPFLSMDRITKESIPETSPIWILDRWWLEKSRLHGGLPPRAAVDPIELGSVLIPWIFLMSVERREPSPDYRFRLVGTANSKLVGYDATGMLASVLFQGADREKIRRSFDETLSTGEPSFWSATIPHKQNFPISVFRAIYPLAADGASADHLIGAAVPDDGLIPK